MSARTRVKTTIIFIVMCVHVCAWRWKQFELLALFVQSAFTALHTACQEGQNRVVEVLVAAKANLDIQTNVSNVIETCTGVFTCGQEIASSVYLLIPGFLIFVVDILVLTNESVFSQFLL